VAWCVENAVQYAGSPPRRRLPNLCRTSTFHADDERLLCCNASFINSPPRCSAAARAKSAHALFPRTTARNPLFTPLPSLSPSGFQRYRSQTCHFSDGLQVLADCWRQCRRVWRGCGSTAGRFNKLQWLGVAWACGSWWLSRPWPLWPRSRTFRRRHQRCQIPQRPHRLRRRQRVARPQM